MSNFLSKALAEGVAAFTCQRAFVDFVAVFLAAVGRNTLLRQPLFRRELRGDRTVAYTRQ